MAGVAGFEPAPTVLESFELKQTLRDGCFSLQEVIMTHEQIKRKVQAEIDVTKNIGDMKIYSFIKNEILNGDELAADKFMLSAQGGYTIGELNAIKFRSQYSIIRNKNRSFVPGRAF